LAGSMWLLNNHFEGDGAQAVTARTYAAVNDERLDH
jgi:hypothetical protein